MIFQIAGFFCLHCFETPGFNWSQSQFCVPMRQYEGPWLLLRFLVMNWGFRVAFCASSR